jgi:phage minor structural protein
MIKIYDNSLKPKAILENAYGISYEKGFNEIWTAAFSLPLDDPKNIEVEPLDYAEVTDNINGEYIGLFRVIPSVTKKSDNDLSITYQLEHVLATLLDDILFMYHQVDGLPTKDSLQYIIDRQNTKRWKLGTVAITRYFSYKFENDNLLSGLFSIPKPFDVPYQWTWDTTSYPWTLNLVAPETAVTCEIRYSKNQRGIEKEEDPTVTFNRIYPLGYGEGDNILKINSVNNGVPYLEDAESISKYGLRQYIFSDKRFENASTLKASAQALLNEWKVPKVTYKVSAADISSITGEDADKLKMGRLVRMVDPDLGTIEARILKESKSDMLGSPGDIQLEIASKTEDLSTTYADLTRRQQINELYAQGNTCMDSHDFEDNADSTNPATMMFYLPDELVKLNRLDLTFECTNFRAYSKAAETTSTTTKTTTSGGGQSVTSGSGGSVVATSSSGGGTSVSSGSGGGTTATSSNFIEQHLMSGVPENAVGTTNYGNHLHEVVIPGHNHDVTIGNHTHSVSIGNHTHSVSIGNHSHTVDISPHSHSVDIPGHGHNLIYGIYKHPILPTQTTIKVDGITVPFTEINGDIVDLVPYLAKETNGSIKRGSHKIEITPNDLARISAQVTSQFFIQSRGQYSL